MTLAPVPYTRPAPTPAIVDRAHSVIDLLPTYIELAERIANTEFVPTALRRRPEAVLAALMSGAERNLGPMESLRSINIIEGKPTLSAEIMRAMVYAAGHEIEIVESNAQRATLVGRRAGSTSTSPPFTWTMDRAKRARLSGKRNWIEYPEAMLLARASADLCRAVFPDVIAGLAAAEEVDDDQPMPAPATTTKRAPARRLSAALPSAETTATASSVRLPEPEAVVIDDAGAAGMHSPAAPSTVPDDGIPGSDRPTWGSAPAPPADPQPSQEPPEPPRGHDPNFARRLHAEMTKAFPGVPAATRDRWRHGLVAVITRKRPDGPIVSSSELTYDEQLFLSDLLLRFQAGQGSVTDGPDDSIEFRPGGGWCYTIDLDPPTVSARRGDPDPDPVSTAVAADLDDEPPQLPEEADDG